MRKARLIIGNKKQESDKISLCEIYKGWVNSNLILKFKFGADVGLIVGIHNLAKF